MLAATGSVNLPQIANVMVGFEALISAGVLWMFVHTFYRSANGHFFFESMQFRWHRIPTTFAILTLTLLLCRGKIGKQKVCIH
jgi:hypothetical protein